MTEENMAEETNSELTPIGDDSGEVMELSLESDEGVKPKAQTVNDEASDYWRRKYEKAQSEANHVSQYQNVITALEGDPDLVNVLEQHISGEIVSSRNEIDEDDPWGENLTAAKPTPKPVQPDNGLDTREHDAEVAKMQIEIQTFLGGLMDNGVPDHTTDEFLEFLKNPSGVTVQDLWQAYSGKKEREGKPVQNAKKDKPKGSPSVNDMGGTTDRPEANQYTSHEGGQNYVPGANDI